MKTITQYLTELVSDAFERCGYDRSLGVVSVSDRMDLCQFQCNGAFAAAKQYKKAPFLIAGEVAEILAQDERFGKAEVAKPGFLNLTLSDAFLSDWCGRMGTDEHLGIPQVQTKKTVLIDYGGANVAKPLHIGHLRSANIGEALKRLALAMGIHALGDVHLGDWGLQIGLVIAEMEERNPAGRCFQPDFDPETEKAEPIDINSLNEIYPFASQKSKTDAAFKEKAQRITQELQAGRAGYVALWREIMRVSVADLKENYRKLNATFDLWYGESDAEPYIPELLDRLTKQGLLEESNGALIVQVEEEGDKAPVPPVIVKKSDNSYNYATTDLATIIQREKDFAPNELWYVVDKRQSLHFLQVFRCAKKAGLVPPETKLIHLGFGTMNGSDGKPYKTRDGGVMQLSSLLEMAVDAAAEKISSTEFTSEEERQETARRVGMAAIKFGDLINDYARDYVFDLEKFLAFEGKTGVYLLYTATRIQSILRKAEATQDNTAIAGVYTESQRELLLTLALCADAFQQALQELAPNCVCESAYQLASAFSKFYHDCHILNETDPQKKAAWLSLCGLTYRMLALHLQVLGIELVERM